MFWFGKLEILKAHGVNSLEHERHLSKHMIDDLIYFVQHTTLCRGHLILLKHLIVIYINKEVER